MNRKIPAAVTVIALAAVTACSTASSKTTNNPPHATTFSVAELEPPSFVPGQDDGIAADELNALFAPLTKFNAANHLTYVQASSVVPNATATVWTVTIRPGWKFQDGEPVTAQSYASAWNATAYGPNAWAGNGDFTEIDGYAALNPPKGQPAARALSGVRVVSATAIQVRLTRPDSQFPQELSLPGFLPLPATYFKNPKAWQAKPIGDGPFEVSGSWQPNKALTMVRYPAYQGQRPKADGVTFEIYTSQAAAYTALQAGQVDITAIGPATYATAEQEMPARVVAYAAPAVDYLGFPLYNAYFGNKLVREAISLAIDRATITRVLYAGLAEPASAILPPAEQGAPLNVCGYCGYDPAQARALLARAGGWKGPFVLWYPTGVGYDQAAQAIANDLTQNLGLKVTLNAVPPASWFPSLAGQKVTNGIYIGHWGAYFPSMQNTLASLFETTGTGYIESWYSTPALTRVINAGDGAASLSAAQADYRQAEQLIMADFPVVPLYDRDYVYAYTSAVTNVIIDCNQIELSEVAVR
jgi:oligopeptide transport system substrate-binding protein